MMIKSVITNILDIISPRFCTICGERLSSQEWGICSPCCMSLPRTDFQYEPIDNKMHKLFFGKVTTQKAASLFYFIPHTDSSRIVYSFKYCGNYHMATIMGRMIATEFSDSSFFDDIDTLVPVPLTKKRRRERGYNQCEELARGISMITGIPINTKSLRRKKFIVSQTLLSQQERQENVKDVFFNADKHSLEGKHILIIDDIMTTGATIRACIEAMNDIKGVKFSVLTLGFTKS